MKKQKLLMLVAVALVVLAGAALADPLEGELGILTASTLAGNNPATGIPWVNGDTYRFAFFTSGGIIATSADISTYNAFVQGLANATGVYAIGADEGVTWKLIGSTSAVDARDNTSTNPTVDGTGEAIFLLDGSTIVANDYADLWDGSIQHIINRTEQGDVSTYWPFTGTYLDGTKTTGHASSFAVLGGSGEIHQGNSSSTTEWIWRANTSTPATPEHQVYALSDPLVIVGGDPVIPDVTGQPQATAEANIIAAGYTVGVVTTSYSDTVPAGDVISQGAVGPATSGTAVDLVVSLGAPIEPCIEGDIDGNCIVNIFDLALFFKQWLEDRYPFIESAGLVVIEAEHYLTNSPAGAHMWVVKDIAGSIGDGCVQALPDIGASIDTDIDTTSPHLTYEIEFSTTGTYYVWVRGMADNASDDSVHYGVDGVAVSTGAGDSIQVSTDGTFEWSNGSGASINISSAETHTLDVWMREDGIFIDRLLLTTDSGYTPDQPDESASVIELIADLDGIDGVNMRDYALFSRNWMDSNSPVIINEFMASNATTLDDEDDDSSDWIEIYNRSETTVDMTDWYLTDKASVLNKWQFPAGLVLEPGEYAVIFASGKGDPSHPMYHPMHTNFELNAGGEYLGLCFPDQSVAYEYSLEYPDQVTDVSYGLFGGQLQYFANPTPGEANQSGFFGLVPDTKFSIDRGFYDTSFSVAITCDDPNATIRYTTDGEEPTATYGNDYVGPISITGTTVLRAKASRPGWIPSNVDTQTYIFVSDVKIQSLDGSAPGSNWPTGDVNGQYMNYGMDPEIVVDNPTYASQIEDSLLGIPSISISTSSDNLFGSSNGIYVNADQEGVAWERPASMELIYPDGTDGFQIDMGIRIRGGWSRKDGNPKHAFRCFFRSKYGDSKLRYPLFGTEGVDEFDKIDLRCAQNHSWAFCHNNDASFVHEVFTRDTQAAMGEPYTRSRYYHLYLNGHYWGLFQTQERSEARYAKSYFGGEVEDYDVVKQGGAGGAVDYTDGNLDAFERLYNATVTTDLASNTNYFRVQGKNADGTENPAYEKLLDIDNTLAYVLMVYWFSGKDFPINFKYNDRLGINNMYCIYNRTNPDGWKFFIHDAEHTFGFQDSFAGQKDRTIFLNFGAAPYSGYLFFNPLWLHQELMDNTEYQIAFADAVHKHLFNGGALSEDKCFDRLFERLPQVEPAIVAESARWGDAVRTWAGGYQTCGQDKGDAYPPATKTHWDNGILRIIGWMTGRTDLVLGWIKNRTELHYPSIDPPVLKINGATQYGGYITAGDLLSMTNPNGGGTTIYYTLDGSDPREIGGTVNQSASIYDEGISVVVESENFESGLGNWINVSSGDTHDWTRNSGETASSGTGPSTGANGSSYYMYLETSSSGANDAGDTAILEGPQVSGTNLQLSFYYHMYGSNMGALNVDVYSGGSWTDSIWSLSGQQHESNGEAYTQATVDLSGYSTPLKVRFRGVAAGDYRGDMAIDDIEIAEATTGGAAVALNETTYVKARVKNGSEWSALSEAIYAIPMVAQKLRITELMYHPAGDPNTEFIEVMNIHPTDTINLALVRFTNGVYFEFPPYTLIAGQRAVVVKNQAAFETRYGTGINVVPGEYSGSLSNGGEEIDLDDALGTEIHDFDYDDDWYPSTDGGGTSLTIRDPNSTDPNDWDRRRGWQASTIVGGTPGEEDIGPQPGDVVINEVLAHSDVEIYDWIELRNISNKTINIGGWYLTDSDKDDPNRMKYQIAAGTTLEPNEYIVFYEDQHFGNPADPGTNEVYALSENGEDMYLFYDAGGTLVELAHEDFGASDPDTAFGRYIKSVLDGGVNFVAMSVNTPGLPNSYPPKVGPIVINEFAYNPAGSDNAEFVEFLNISALPVDLYEDGNPNNPWRFVDDAGDNTPGLEYFFPKGASAVTLQPGEYFLLVKDEGAFEAAFNNNNDISTLNVQWDDWIDVSDGNLSNGGEQPQLSKPGEPSYYIRVDRVTYDDDPPWPTEPDGSNDDVLERLTDEYGNHLYGNDVINWQADAPTPGKDNATPP